MNLKHFPQQLEEWFTYLINIHNKQQRYQNI